MNNSRETPVFVIRTSGFCSHLFDIVLKLDCAALNPSIFVELYSICREYSLVFFASYILD